MAKSPPPVETVAKVLEGYASRGVFRGFSRGPTRKQRTIFKMLWHRDRLFELILDVPSHTMRIPVVLPEVPARSKMYSDFKEFTKARFLPDLPVHRRIDPRKVRIRCGNRSGNAFLTLTLLNRDYEYATRKLIHLVHEIFLDFLATGRYYEYMVETFELDPDRM